MFPSLGHTLILLGLQACLSSLVSSFYLPSFDFKHRLLDVRQEDPPKGYNEHHFLWKNGQRSMLAWENPFNDFPKFHGSQTHTRRDIPQDLKDRIDRAMENVSRLPHYFWTGTLSPHTDRRGDSVQWRARRLSIEQGGVTLEDTVVREGLNLPEWSQQDAQAREIWTYASNRFAQTATGNAFVFRGERVYEGNVFDTEEFGNLQRNPQVPQVYEILVRARHVEAPRLIWSAQPDPPSQNQHQTAVACTVHAHHGGFYREGVSGQSANNAEFTRFGFFYGGQRSSRNEGAYTYSIRPEVRSDSPTQSNMATWISAHETFDARFPTATATIPSEINVGGNWMPYATACPWIDDPGKMQGLKLRTLPLGDSITYGSGNSPGHEYSYRGRFKQIVLVPPGFNNNGKRADSNNTIDYIGSVRSGEVDDPDNEGHPDAEINDLKKYTEKDLASKPNVILLLAGTNDIKNGHKDGAVDRLMSLLDDLAKKLPDAIILVGSIPQIGQADKENDANEFNDAVENVLLQRMAQGQRVLPVYMENLASELGDFDGDINPSEAGYVKIADAFWEGLLQAVNMGWYKPAEGDLEGPVGSTPTPGNGTEICSGSKFGIETGTIKQHYAPGNDREYTAYEIFNTNCSHYNEIGIAPGQNACTVGTFSCTPEPITFSSVILQGKFTCSPAPAGQKCGQKAISVCCSDGSNSSDNSESTVPVGGSGGTGGGTGSSDENSESTVPVRGSGG